MNFLDLIWLIPIVPLIGAAIMLAVGRQLSKSVVSLICPGAVGISFILSLGAVVQLASLPEKVNRIISGFESGEIKTACVRAVAVLDASDFCVGRRVHGLCKGHPVIIDSLPPVWNGDLAQRGSAERRADVFEIETVGVKPVGVIQEVVVEPEPEIAVSAEFDQRRERHVLNRREKVIPCQRLAQVRLYLPGSESGKL